MIPLSKGLKGAGHFFFLAVILQLWSLGTFGQAEQIEFVGKPALCRYSSSTEKVIRVYQDHIILANPEATEKDSIHINGIGVLILSHNIHHIKDKIILTKKGSGLVYEVSGGKLNRVDRSMDHNFQAESLEFIRNDTLFRHGGRGFWEANNLFIFFSFDTYEWEIVRPLQGESFPPGLFGHHGIIAGSDIFIYGGFMFNPNNAAQHLFNEEIWKFNFPERRWTRLGQLNSEEILPTLKEFDWKGVRSSMVVIDQPRYYTMHQWTVQFDPGRNEAQFYPAIPRMTKLVPYENLEHFIYKDHFYQYVSSNMHTRRGSTQTFVLFRIPLKKFLKQPDRTLPIYDVEKSKSWIWSLIIIPFLLIPGYFIWNQKQKKLIRPKAILNKGGLSFNSMDYALSPVALTVLRLLLSRDQDVLSSEIMEITSKPGLDYPNQVRLKNQVIRSLNLELRSIFRTNDDIIRQTSSPVDRRIKCYCIDKNWFDESERS